MNVQSAIPGAKNRGRERNTRETSNLISGQVFSHLKGEIVYSRLEPGSFVTETELIRRYHYPITPLRRALVQLAECELIVPMPRQGYQIAAVSLKAINDVFDARALIEPAATAMAAHRATPELIKELEALDAICQEGCVVGDLKSEEKFLSANMGIHAKILAAAGNRHLFRFHSQILDETERTFYIVMRLFGCSRRLRHSHADLIGALAAGDADRAREIAAEEISNSRTVFIETITSTEQFQRLHISGLAPSVLPAAPTSDEKAARGSKKARSAKHGKSPAKG